MKGQETDVFDLSDFDLMSVGIEMVVEKIQDTLTSQSLGEDWNQLPPLPQGPLDLPPLPSQDLLFLEKILAMPLPPMIDLEE